MRSRSTLWLHLRRRRSNDHPKSSVERGVQGRQQQHHPESRQHRRAGVPDQGELLRAGFAQRANLLLPRKGLGLPGLHAERERQQLLRRKKRHLRRRAFFRGDQRDWREIHQIVGEFWLISGISTWKC